MSVKFTVKELSEKYGVESIVASGFLKFLEVRGLAAVVEKRNSNPGGKGRSANVYEIEDSVTLNFKD